MSMTWEEAHILRECIQALRVAHAVMRDGGGFGTRIGSSRRTVGETLTLTVEHIDAYEKWARENNPATSLRANIGSA